MFVLQPVPGGYVVKNTDTGATTVRMSKAGAERVLKDLNKRPPAKRVGPHTAAQVLAATDQLPRYFGNTGHKVYISDVLRALPGLTKQQLLEMHKRGEIELSRLDMPAAAKEHGEFSKIDASEIQWFNATLHLIQPPNVVQRMGGFLLGR
jgi:hypothetical protein